MARLHSKLSNIDLVLVMAGMEVPIAIIIIITVNITGSNSYPRVYESPLVFRQQSGGQLSEKMQQHIMKGVIIKIATRAMTKAPT